MLRLRYGCAGLDQGCCMIWTSIHLMPVKVQCYELVIKVQCYGLVIKVQCYGLVVQW